MLPEPLKTFVAVRASLQASTASGGQCSGTITLDAGVVGALRQLAQLGLAQPTGRLAGRAMYLDQLTSDSAGLMDVALVPYALRQQSGVIYCETLDELVAQFKTAPGSPYYIHELSYFSASAQQKPDAVKRYDAIQQLIAFLKQIADAAVPDGADLSLYFFSKAALPIPIAFGTAHLRDIPGLTEFMANIMQPETRGQRLEIFKSVLVDQLLAFPAELRFGTLLELWPRIVQSYEHSYKLYLQNFSWEKLRSEIDKEKFELGKKISAAVSDIQTKLIAIPAAFVLAVTQIHKSESALANGLVLVGAIVFAVLLELLLKNQRRYLSGLEQESASIFERLRKEYTGLPDLSQDWEELARAVQHQRRALALISFCNWSVPIATLLNLIILYW